MAKVGLTKLELQKEIPPYEFDWGNGNVIEIKQYLPIQEKLELISRVINKSIDEGKFYNPGKVQLFFDLELAYTYTNINFTEKQKEDFLKTYDLLASNGFFQSLKGVWMSSSEIDCLKKWLKESLESIYQYNQSVMGILENVKNNYNELDFDINNIQAAIQNPENLSLLKELMPLMDLA